MAKKITFVDTDLRPYFGDVDRTQQSIASELQLSQGAVSRWLSSERDIFIRRYSNGKIEAYERRPARRLGRAVKFA